MLAEILLAWLAGAGAAQPDLEALLDSGRYAEAWELADRASDATERARWRAEILYRAGDPAGSLQAAREGLESAPLQLQLLHRATASAAWLGDPASTREWATRLSRAVQGAQLAPENRGGWESAALQFRNEAERLESALAARKSALRRARLAVLGTTIVLAGAMARGLVRAPRARTSAEFQGRSSRPVS